ncbi:MAG: MucB/RseB C-terminal domain-containing protein [Aeromonas sp.]
MRFPLFLARAPRAYLALCCALSSPLASSEPLAPSALLAAMQQAANSQNYALAMVKVKQGRLETLRLSHAVIAEQSVAHLSYLDGVATEYLQRGNEATFFEPHQAPYTLAGARLPNRWLRLMASPLPQVLQHYDPLLAGRSRVAGRVAQVIRLAPKSADKYGWVLWIDEQSHLLLRLDLLDNNGEVVEQLLGIDLQRYASPSEQQRALATRSTQPALKLKQHALTPPQQHPWRVRWLPEGFQLRSQDHHALINTQQAVEHMLLSDGLVDVSVYVGEPSLPAQRSTLVRSGATSLVSFLTRNGQEITVVGEVPAATAQRIAQSVQALVPATSPAPR